MSSDKSQHSEAKQIELMQKNLSASPVPMEPPPTYSEVNSISDFDKDNPVPADHAPLVPPAGNQSVDSPSASSLSQNKEQQPIVNQPKMNSEKHVQPQNSKNARDRKRDDEDNNCYTSFCNLCCMETCGCMVMCLEACATSLQCVIACFMCSELCQ